jgi:hypothetical protein
MQVLRDELSIERAIAVLPDREVAALLSARLSFKHEEEDDIDGLFTVVFVEPGDTLSTVDTAAHGLLLSNPYSGRRSGDASYVPCCEWLEEHRSFYDIGFILSDGGDCLEVVVPKLAGVDETLLELCERHATPASEATR